MIRQCLLTIALVFPVLAMACETEFRGGSEGAGVYRGNGPQNITEIAYFIRPSHRRINGFNWGTRDTDSAPVINGNTVYTIHRGGVTAIDLSARMEKWMFLWSYIGASLGVDDQFIYVGGHQGFAAIDKKTGQPFWKISLPENTHGIFLLLNNGVAYLRVAKTVYAIRAKTGEEIWHFEVGENRIYFPGISEGVLYLGDESHIYALEAMTGSLKWSYKIVRQEEGPPLSVFFSTVSDGILFFPCENSLCAMDLQKRTLKWKKSFSHMGNMVSVKDGIVYVGSADGMHAIDSNSGEEKWFFSVDGGINSNLAINERTIFFSGVNHDSHVYAVERLTGKELWRFKSSYGQVSAPIICDDLLYFSSPDGLYGIR